MMTDCFGHYLELPFVDDALIAETNGLRFLGNGQKSGRVQSVFWRLLVIKPEAMPWQVGRSWVEIPVPAKVFFSKSLC